MQSLSPVSVCSIGAETGVAAANAAAAAAAQDGPIDLSMKTSRSSVHSFHDSDDADSELPEAAASSQRRKFYQLEAECSATSVLSSHSNSSHSSTVSAGEAPEARVVVVVRVAAVVARLRRLRGGPQRGQRHAGHLCLRLSREWRVASGDSERREWVEPSGWLANHLSLPRSTVRCSVSYTVYFSQARVVFLRLEFDLRRRN
ncbi:hypothetical protein KR093_007537 [Drosophila rubida]|uniref:Uncharacterized protein n=1 Tax=Drosophila rubida TaxID=30044 RepID=A0AAD4K0Q8_9MUSC|nr:hypothetical protein KR093_007537 [Drosophila rubida]